MHVVRRSAHASHLHIHGCYAECRSAVLYAGISASHDVLLSAGAFQQKASSAVFAAPLAMPVAWLQGQHTSSSTSEPCAHSVETQAFCMLARQPVSAVALHCTCIFVMPVFCVLICGVDLALHTILTFVLQDAQLASDVQRVSSVVQCAKSLLQSDNSRRGQAAVQLLELLASWSDGLGPVFQLWAHMFVSERTVDTLLAAAERHNKSLPAAQQRTPWLDGGVSTFAVRLGQHKVTLDNALSSNVSEAC